MNIDKIVEILDEEFDTSNINEDFSALFDNLFIKKSLYSFRKEGKNTGLLIKNSDEVNKIYTAFSPSRFILEEIRMKGIVNVLLIVKNPFDWDGRRNGGGFIHFKDRDYLLMEGMGISVYSLSSVLDKNRNDKVVSSAYAFAKATKFKVEEEFASTFDNPANKVGIIGKFPERNMKDIANRLNKTLDYKVKVRKIEEDGGKIAIVSSGFDPHIAQQAKELGVNTLIVGTITPNSSEQDKKTYKERLSKVNKFGLNIIGCSKYLMEKWTMQYSTAYFSEILKTEFLEDKEALNLLE